MDVRVAQQGSEAFIEQRRPQEPAVMCGQEGRNAARASCTQRRHKEAQFRSTANGLAQGRTANWLTAIDTNNAASLKEARVDHSEGGVCVTSIQGGVERRNSSMPASI